jgi:hypothetical protein
MRVKNLLNQFYYFAALTAIFAGISSCKSSSTATTSVQVINVSPDAGTINFFLSGNLKTTSPVAYGNSSSYFSTVAGNQTGEVKSATTGVSLASNPVSIASDSYYSVFVMGQALTNNINYTIVQDKLNRPTEGKAKIRFVHAVSAAPQVNLLLNSNVIFSAKAFKSVSDYTEITPGTYSIRATSSDITSVGVTTAFNQTFENGKIYTIIFKGAVGATTDALKLNLGVMANN